MVTAGGVSLASLPLSAEKVSAQIGVVCGSCDRYSPMGTGICACARTLAIETTAPVRAAPPASKLAAPPPSPPPKSPPPKSPPPNLWSADELKRRRQPSVPNVPGPAAEAAPANGQDAAGAAVRAQAVETALSSADVSDEEISAEPHGRSELSQEELELMDQAKNYVCKSCSTPVPLGHKFCGRCGAAIPTEVANARTQFFGQLQVPGKAKLILIRGEGIEGLSYQLNAEQHSVGRNGQIVFPDDLFVSAKHANLFYRGGRLVVRDESSQNGVFWRVRVPMEISPGDTFLAGEQLFLVEGAPRPNDGPAPDGTYFYSSPKHQTQFKLVQILEGGPQGMAVCARGRTLQIGREGSDLNFPGDLYMSASHCKVEEAGGKLTLSDLGSRNGTFVRLKTEKELSHGDYLFIGRKLLRVEITAN